MKSNLNISIKSHNLHFFVVSVDNLSANLMQNENIKLIQIGHSNLNFSLLQNIYIQSRRFLHKYTYLFGNKF